MWTFSKLWSTVATLNSSICSICNRNVFNNYVNKSWGKKHTQKIEIETFQEVKRKFDSFEQCLIFRLCKPGHT